jgi:hypothetical protein
MRCPVILLFLFWAVGVARGAGLNLYVATNGNDGWSGKLPAPNFRRTDGPFATLERARDAIRESKASRSTEDSPVTVQVRGGVFRREKTFELTAEDSGLPKSPVVYRAYRDELARIVGGVEAREWKPVTDPAILARLDPAARGHVLQSNLGAQGIRNFGALQRRGFGVSVASGSLELIFQDKPMTLARWPNNGWARTTGAPAGKNGGKFGFEGDRPKRWAAAGDVWVHGYWTYDWADTCEKVRSIDVEKREIATEPPHGAYGYSTGKRFFVFNLLEELDEPGEWYLDRRSGILYFWPPAAIELGHPTVSMLEGPFVRLTGVSFFTLRGLTFEDGRADGVVVSGGEGNLIAGCVFRNLGLSAASIDDADQGEHRRALRSGVAACDVYGVGEGGIRLGGGDRATLTPGGNFAVNNHIHDYSRAAFTYHPAIQLTGVGQRVEHNRIHDAPHNALLFAGNDHLIEYNDVYRVCLETGDAGAFYTGRNLTTRGTKIRYNHFRDIARTIETKQGFVDVMSVYLDDCACGTTVYGNIFERGGRAVMIGGGRDNTIENNLFVDCDAAVHVDGRGEGWMKAEFHNPNGTIMTSLKEVPYKRPPYSVRYAHLADILDDEPGLPKYNRILRNICAGPRWIIWLDGLNESKVEVRGNLTASDPGFVNRKEADFRLRRSSPAFALGFKPIPINQIGLVEDEYRKSVEK